MNTPPERGRHNRLLALLCLVVAAALLGYAGCRNQGEQRVPEPGPPVGVDQPLAAQPENQDAVGGTGRVIHVSAQGGMGADGSEAAPFSSLQRALDMAQPGETVRVGPGTYPGPFRTTRPGTPEEPIWIVGDGAKIVEPRQDDENSTDYVFVIGHDHIVFTGFDLSGGDTALRIFGANHARVTYNHIHDVRGECVRVKFFSSNNEIAHNRIERCGLEGFDVSEDDKNGEGIYIGTAPEQLDDNPRDDPDQSNANHVHDNVITPLAECVDVKEDARDNVVENNMCQGSKDPDGGGFSSRGIGTVFIGNTSRNHVGAGIRLGGDDDSDGVGSVVRGNRLVDNEGYGVKIQTEPQKLICGNIVENNGDGASNDEDVEPSQPCPA